MQKPFRVFRKTDSSRLWWLRRRPRTHPLKKREWQLELRWSPRFPLVPCQTAIKMIKRKRVIIHKIRIWKIKNLQQTQSFHFQQIQQSLSGVSPNLAEGFECKHESYALLLTFQKCRCIHRLSVVVICLQHCDTVIVWKNEAQPKTLMINRAVTWLVHCDKHFRKLT